MEVEDIGLRVYEMEWLMCSSSSLHDNHMVATW